MVNMANSTNVNMGLLTLELASGCLNGESARRFVGGGGTVEDGDGASRSEGRR